VDDSSSLSRETLVDQYEARRIVERYKSEVHEIRGRTKGGAGHRIVSGKFAEGDDELRGPGGDRDESEEDLEGGKLKPDGRKYGGDAAGGLLGADAKDGKARVANEAREYLRQGRELLARKNYDKAIEALGRSGALATYQGGEAGAAITSEAERSIALALKGMKDARKETEKLKTQLEDQIKAGEKLDYGQKKLLDRITTRRSRVAQAATTPGLADVEAPTEDMPPRRPPAKVVPETEPEPAKPDAGRPPGAPEDAKPSEERRPDKDARRAPRPPEITRYRYSPVRGGRQKGALPIAFDLPRDAGLPYVFHRPVTGEARAEIELDCRPAADSNTARGVFVLGALGLLGLVGGAVARRRR
jgi:MYXO-CTERM domain-containing protein